MPLSAFGVLETELCADELVVGGGVGWSYDRRRRRAAHFSSAAAAWLYGQRRRRQTGWQSIETAHSLDRRLNYVWFYRGHPLVISLGRWRRKINCEYAWCAQFYSLNELIVHCLISGGSYKCNVECWGDADSAGVENAALENAGLENVGEIWQSLNGWTKEPEKAVQPSLVSLSSLYQ